MMSTMPIGWGGANEPPTPKRQHRWALGNDTLVLAIRLVAKYPHSVPSVQQLQTDFHVSRATAYRWLSAILRARRQ